MKDKVVLIVGGTSGIGAATAKYLSVNNSVVVVGRNEPREDIGDSFYIQGDATLEVDIKRVITQTLRTLGPLTCAFNNMAVVDSPTDVTEITPEIYYNTLDNCLKATMLCTKHELLNMNYGATIVNMASMYGSRAIQIPLSVYTAAKHGIVGYTKTAALEAARKGIRINTISPGWIETKYNESLREDRSVNKSIVERTALNRWGTTLEVAKAVEWLLSKNSSFYVGQDLILDGGYSLT